MPAPFDDERWLSVETQLHQGRLAPSADSGDPVSDPGAPGLGAVPLPSDCMIEAGIRGERARSPHCTLTPYFVCALFPPKSLLTELHKLFFVTVLYQSVQQKT